jgi:hypothetical protein
MGGLIAVAMAFALNAVSPSPALAWGDEGHEIIALIAQAYLEPSVGKAVSDLLAADTDALTTHDIAGEATWADRIRDRQSGRERTAHWHYFDIEIGAPNVDQACFNHPALPAGVWASRGPPQDCIIDKIVQFEAELAQPAMPEPERLLALKFLLHFVGDLHQPLHAADSLDRGGNTKRVSAAGFRTGNLHHFWDTSFVAQLGTDPRRSPPICACTCPPTRSASGGRERPLTGRWRHSRSPVMMPMASFRPEPARQLSARQ